jgi:alcohol dehydrogenase class IV
MNFVLKIPKLIFGLGASRVLPEELSALQAKRPLLLTDRGLIEFGVFDRVTSTLPLEQMHVYADVPENPTFAGVDQAALAIDGIRRVWRYIESATADGQNGEARSQLMMAAFSGGVAIGKGLGPAHAIAITVGDQGLHHGMLSGLGVIATIESMRKHAPDKVGDIANAMGLRRA